jgi:predicted DNA-binding transcriptional regulator AlpA
VNSAPTLDDLLSDPSRVRELPPAAARELFVRLATLQAALTTAILPSVSFEKRTPTVDRFLDAAEVGEMIGKSRSWVEHHVVELPERRRVGGEGRWSQREVEAWMHRCPSWSEQR